MPYVSVEVDIDLAEINTDDLIKELKRRCDHAGKRGVNGSEKKEMMEAIEYVLNIRPVELTTTTIDEQMKFEHVAKVWNKYNSAQVEAALPQF